MPVRDDDAVAAAPPPDRRTDDTGTTGRAGNNPAATRPRLGPGHALVVGGGGLVLAWAAFLAVDVLNVAGSRDAAVAAAGQPVHLWTELFGNGKPVEWLQWLLLATVALVGAATAALASAAADRHRARFWALLAVGAALILIEDAGDPRHQIAEYLFTYVETDWARSSLRLTADAVVFGLIAAPLLWAPLRHGHGLQADRPLRRLLVGGYLAYALAALGSLASNVNDFYQHLGEALLTGVFADRLLPLTGTSTSFWLVDKVVEETVELVGATLLAAAALAAYRAARAAGAGPTDAGGQPGAGSSGTRATRNTD